MEGVGAIFRHSPLTFSKTHKMVHRAVAGADGKTFLERARRKVFVCHVEI
jgi:hypothetical protein